MTPADLQGGEGAASMVVADRFTNPFADHVLHEGAFTAIGYMLRIPSSGGHWVTILNPEFLPTHGTDLPTDCAAVLCDSLFPVPFTLNLDELGELLLASAFDSLQGEQVDVQHFRPQWCCFLLAVQGPAGAAPMLPRWEDEIL